VRGVAGMGGRGGMAGRDDGGQGAGGRLSRRASDPAAEAERRAAQDKMFALDLDRVMNRARPRRSPRTPAPALRRASALFDVTMCWGRVRAFACSVSCTVDA